MKRLLQNLLIIYSIAFLAFGCTTFGSKKKRAERLDTDIEEFSFTSLEEEAERKKGNRL